MWFFDFFYISFDFQGFSGFFRIGIQDFLTKISRDFKSPGSGFIFVGLDQTLNIIIDLFFLFFFKNEFMCDFSRPVFSRKVKLSGILEIVHLDNSAWLVFRGIKGAKKLSEIDKKIFSYYDLRHLDWCANFLWVWNFQIKKW